jgi:hypothetical protein
MPTEGLRHRILQLCADVSPVPEITFAGPVDEALPPEAADRLLGMLRAALGQLGTSAGPALVRVEAAEHLSVMVTGTGPGAPVAVTAANPNSGTSMRSTASWWTFSREAGLIVVSVMPPSLGRDNGRGRGKGSPDPAAAGDFGPWFPGRRRGLLVRRRR